MMAVHAHPDDESTATGGILALYALRGVKIVVVTCTDGDRGDGPDGVKPGDNGHDPCEVAAIRREELRRACAHLGVSHLELLGYHDSGMAAWDIQHHEDAFCATPVESVAKRIGQFDTETYIRASDTTETSIPEDDLLTGLMGMALREVTVPHLSSAVGVAGAAAPDVAGAVYPGGRRRALDAQAGNHTGTYSGGDPGDELALQEPQLGGPGGGAGAD